MTRCLYFDRNVFYHIRNRIDFSDSDLSTLKNAINSGQISVLISLTLIEEHLPVLKSKDPVETGKIEKQLLLDLVDQKKLIKPQAELLRDDVLAYAKNEPAPLPFTSEFSNLEEMLTPSVGDLPDLVKVTNDIQTQKSEVLV